MQIGTPVSDRPATGLRRVGSWTLHVVGVGLAVSALAGFAGGAWWVLDLLSHPRFQYAVLLPLVAVGLAAVGSRRAGIVVGAVAVVNGIALIPMFLASPVAATDGGPELVVASFNVQVGNPDRAGVIEWVAGLDADVVFLWETSQPWRDEFALAELSFHQSDPLQVGTTIGGLVLTREVAQVRLVESGDRSSIEVTVPFGDSEVVIIGAHPFPPVSGRHSAERDQHLETVANFAATIDEPLVVVGDLNATPWSSALRPFKGLLINSMRGFGWQATYPAGGGPSMLPIDHLLHNDYFTTIDRRVGPDLGSDHLPIIVRLGTPRLRR